MAFNAANRLAVVTGSNKGIGLEIIRQLTKQHHVRCILAARSEERGKQAQADLKNDGLDVMFHQLDITNEDSVKSFAKYIQEKHDGKLDILVNNAGFAFKGSTFGADEAQQTLDVNYYGTKRITEALLPFVRAAHGRIVNVASFAGQLKQVSRHLQEQFTSPELTVTRLDELMKQYVQDVRAGDHKDKGWSNSMYGISKLAEIAYTMIVARREKENHVLVNAVCPGHCQTDMSSHTGKRSAAQGAETPVMLSVIDENELSTGGFYQDKHPLAW